LIKPTNLHTDADKYQLGMGGWSKTLAPLFIEFIGGIKDGDRLLALIRHYFEAAQAMSPTAVGNGTQP
jgi:hypothetical protein